MKPITISAPGSERVDIDLMKLVDTRLLVQANSGGGKSGTLRLIAERAAGQVQTIILDNEGEFATLREKIDVLLVGDAGELAADVRSAGLLARRLLETQVSAVIDLYELPLADRRRFVANFLNHLIALPRNLWRPTLIMLDEAHLYVPQGSEEESSRAVIALQSQGRKRGYCGILATQRLSKLHKDAAAECNNVLIGRTWLDVDQKRAGDILGMSKADRAALRDLETREFFGFGPAFSANGVFKTKTADVATTMPKAGHRFEVAVPPPSSKVRGLLQAEFANMPDEAEAEIRDLDAAKREISKLTRELKAKPVPAATDLDVIHAQAKAMKDARAEWSSRVKALEDKLRTVQANIARVGKLFGQAFAINERIADELLKIDATPVALSAVESPKPRPPYVPGSDPVTGLPPRPRIVSVTGDLSGPEQRILDAIAWLESIGVREPEQTAVAFLAGYTVGGGAFNNPRGALRTKGLIDYRGSCLALTDDGRAKANFPEASLTAEELQRRVLERLPGPEQKILRILLEEYPRAVENDDLARRAGYEPGGGAFNNPRGRLRTLGLAEYPERGRVVATKLLFLEQA